VAVLTPAVEEGATSPPHPGSNQTTVHEIKTTEDMITKTRTTSVEMILKMKTNSFKSKCATNKLFCQKAID
jgi:hypothetical protein